MELRLLGPLEVRDGERLVPLPRKKHRALLALLALRAGEVVSADVLIEELWGDRPPKTARDALHNYVSQLRRALGDDLIETRDPGYVLNVEPEQLDLLRFERLAEEARHGSAEERSVELRAALALWRGSPLADLAYEEFGLVEAARLEELRVTAREDLIDAELELGRNAELVPQLEALILEHPLRERLRGQLMLALYRAGRQGDALQAYRDARSALVADLGIEPGVQLRTLERAMLDQDPALDLPAVLPRVEERRQTVTILFCELAPAEDIDPERLRRQSVRALAQARSTIELHGGSAETRAGDELLGVFGVPAAHEDDALRALRAAAELLEALPGVRIGIDTGEALVGHGFVSGAVLTRAKRLRRAASPGEALLGQATTELCRGRLESEPVETGFRLLSVADGPRPTPARETRLVGRRRELTALLRAYEDACAQGQCQLVAIVGEPGIGKTRLAQELVARVRESAMALVGHCTSYGDGAAWLPLSEMLERAGERLDATLAAAGSPGEIFLAARGVFERLAADQPLVLVFDDVHWADPTLLDLVEYLAAHAGGPILCLGLARPELLDERPGLSEGAVVLGPLTDRQAETLAAEVEPELRTRLVSTAGGNPLFLEQLIAFASEGGPLDTVPPAVEALLAARLDLLGPEERALLHRAAVVGRSFEPAVLDELGADVGCLHDLERKGFLQRRRRGGFRFHHVLVHDLAYASLPKAERAELHEQLADWLDERGEPDELVGYHLGQAAALRHELGRIDGRTRRLAAAAGARLGAAGIEAWKRGETPATVNLLGRAAELLPTADPFRLELLCELGPALRTGGELARAEEMLLGAVETAAGERDRRLELRARLELAGVRLVSQRGRTADELLEVAAEGIPVFEAVEDDRSLARAWRWIAHVHGGIRYRFGAAVEAAEQALVYYRRSGWSTSTCLDDLATAFWAGPIPVPEGIRRCRELLSEADLGGEARVLGGLAILEAMRGRFAEARRLLDRAGALYEQLGQSSIATATCGELAARIELLAGDPDAAERKARESCVALEQMGDHAQLATRAVDLGEALLAQDAEDLADEWILVARELGANDDMSTQILCRTVRAEILARRGEIDNAEAVAREGVRLAEATDALNHHARALVGLGEVLRSGGKASEAARTVEQSIEIFERKGNVVGARQARSMLAALAIA